MGGYYDEEEKSRCGRRSFGQDEEKIREIECRPG